MASVKPVPEGFHTVSMHLWQQDCGKAIAFYKEAFGAEELVRKLGPDGHLVMHAVLRIGDTLVMMADEWPDSHERAPATAGGTTIGMWIYVEDADAVFQQAVGAGAEVTMPIWDTFWGDRMGKVRDPFGHSWSIATHKEVLSDEEIDRRAAEWFATQGG